MPRQVAPNRDMGPCCVIWDPSGDNLDFKPTLGSVTYTSDVQSEDIMHDEHGVVPVNAMITGRPVTLIVPMTSPNLIAMQATMPSSTTHKGAGRTVVLRVPNVVGTLMFADAKELILQPVLDQVCSTDINEWVHFWRVFPIESHEIANSLTDQKVFSVTFKVFVDDSSGNVGQIYRYGPAPS